MEKFNLTEEQKKLVLIRFKSLNPNSKILLGSNGQYTVKELMKEVEKGSDFGNKIVQVQIKMLQMLSSGVNG